jgi:hypothetical protein
MVSINSYNITQFYWNPVDFNIVGEQLKLKKIPLLFTNGISLNFYDCLSGLNDIKYNNNTGLILTGLLNNTDIIEDKEKPKSTTSLEFIDSIFISNDGGYYRYDKIQKKSFNTGGNIFTIDDKIKINIIDDLNVTIQSNSGFFLTDQNITGDDSLVFSSKQRDYLNQKFNYILGDDNILLFKNDSNYSTAIMQGSANNLILSSFNTTTLPNECVIGLLSYNNISNNDTTVIDSFLVKYDTNPILNQKNLSILEKIDYNQNYLCMFPYETFDVLNGKTSVDFYLHGLKNYQTPEYNYNNNSLNRTYKKIYTGTNQYKGLDKVYLGYETNTKVIEFNPNESTKFYYNATAQILPLTASSLVSDGAIGGQYPHISDRISVKTKNNFNESNELSFLTQDNNSNNTYLCSWLFKSPDTNNHIWYDRYYNAAYYSMNQALSSAKMVYNDYSLENGRMVYDIPSQMKLLPGNLYEYYHVGKNDSLKHLEYLDSIYFGKRSIKSKILSISAWDTTPLIDNSYYNNNGLIYNATPANFNLDSFKFDGNQYIVFPAKTELLPTFNITTSMWFYVDNWQNIKGYQLFGNYYNSGLGLINESRVFMPFITILNNATKRLYNFNYRFGITSTLTLPSTADSSSFEFIQKLSDYTYWVFDLKSNKAVKYDVDDMVLVNTSISIGTISQVETDSSENIYLYDNTSKSYTIIDGVYGNNIGSGNLSEYSNRLEIDLFDNVVPVYGNASVIDNNNILWEVIGNNLYKSEYDPEDILRTKRDVFAVLGPTKQLTCDYYNNIWIISASDQYIKLDANRNFEFVKSFSKTTLPVEPNCPPAPDIPAVDESALIENFQFLSNTSYTYIVDDFLNLFIVTKPAPQPTHPTPVTYNRERYINFINSPNLNTTIACQLTATSEDQAIIVDQTDNEAYILNQSGLPIIKTNFQGLLGKKEKLSIVARGDFTGYQNVRKYRNSQNRLSWKFKFDDGSGNLSLTSLNYSISALSKGWHHFSFVFNSLNGFANYYIDSKMVDNISINSGSQLVYDYRTSFVLGTTTLKNTILNNILNIDDGYNFVGSVSDLKIYNIPLNDSDIQQLYLSSKYSKENNILKWNMDIGKREYVEEIKHWFQYRLPGNKSKYYNINVHNLKVDDSIKANIESAIKNIINRISPAYSELNTIKWK